MTAERFPIAPLLAATPLPHRALAARAGIDPAGLLRIVRKGGTVNEEHADRLAVAAGTHPALIWPEWLEFGLPEHGTLARHRRGCRCIPCTDTRRAHERAWHRDRQRANGATA